MSIDDGDPSCPECGEPVGTNASYCMHCGAEFDFADGVEEDGGGLLDSIIDAIDGTTDESPEVESTAATVENERGGTVGGDTDAGATASVTADTGSTASGGSDDGSTASGGAGGGSTASRGAEAGTADDGGGLLDPDGLLDNSLTVLVGIAAGIVIGIFSLFVFIPTLGLWGGLVGLVTWLLATAYLSRRRTVFDAAQQGAYGFAVLLLSLSVVFALEDGGGLSSRLETFVTSLLGLGVVAAIVAAVGYVFGLKGVE